MATWNHKLALIRLESVSAFSNAVLRPTSDGYSDHERAVMQSATISGQLRSKSTERDHSWCVYQKHHPVFSISNAVLLSAGSI